MSPLTTPSGVLKATTRGVGSAFKGPWPRPAVTTTMTGRQEASVRCISIDTCNGKHSTSLPMDYFKRLLEEACPNHAYPIQHNLKECGMTRRFMTSGSLTWGAELNVGLDGSDMAPFRMENVIVMVHGGHPPSRR
jgi:hypothetical protein